MSFSNAPRRDHYQDPRARKTKMQSICVFQFPKCAFPSLESFPGCLLYIFFVLAYWSMHLLLQALNNFQLDKEIAHD